MMNGQNIKPEPTESTVPLPPAGNTARYALLLVVITFAVYWPTLFNDFVILDDDFNVYRNAYLHPVTFENWLYFWKAPLNISYVPLVYTTHAVEMLLWGDHPLGYHLVNILLHALATLVLFKLLLRFVGDARAAAVGALVFAIHPLQAESVSWVTGRWAVLSGWLGLLAIWQYVIWVETRRPIRYVLSLLAFVLALMSKPAMASLPLSVFLIDALILKRRLREVIFPIAPMLLLSFVWIILARKVQPTADMSYIPPLWLRPLVAGDALTFYLYKLLVPLWFGPDYGRSPQYVLQHTCVYLTAAVPCILLVAIWVRAGRGTLLAAAGLFIAGVVSTLGLVPFVFQDLSTVADRYVYLALMGPALAVAWLFTRYRTRSIPAIGLAVLAALGIRTFFQTYHWHNSDTLCTHALAMNSDSSWLLAAQGNLLVEQGKLDQAIDRYRRVLRTRPKYTEILNNLGSVLIRTGKIDEAIEQFTLAVQYRPDYAVVHANLASAFLIQRKIPQAIEHYEKSLVSEPNNPGVHTTTANLLMRLGKLDRAIEHYRQAIVQNPELPEPANHLAWLYATCADAKRRDAVEAVRLAEQACRLTDHANASYLDTLAAAYAEAGRYQDAVNTARRARERADIATQARLRDSIEQRIKLYEGHKPFRE